MIPSAIAAICKELRDSGLTGRLLTYQRLWHNFRDTHPCHRG